MTGPTTANNTELLRMRELALEDIAAAEAELAAIDAELMRRKVVYPRLAIS